MLLQRQHFLLSYLDSECWSGWGLNLQPLAQQTGTYPIELTGQRLQSPKSICMGGKCNDWSRAKVNESIDHASQKAFYIRDLQQNFPHY